uniref:peptidylprolyl isomerase n=1 Tax=Chromera velia CCMP2878 TaxID=1169474 RepID=A0A0G4FPX9_9ALVE|eukprot:Cvel_17964.t1-p1 / transcript=Cvel_17964.t1 / gene=Cvel_17964 / organism=Chromera_velia_CCMP2878 / gene_product=Peptidyl-prolyl cis-trans isomerase cyp15, putative / transcript_product=Peptidyl-prolyl cis-trans isomerase cyp15, putative / location=Cvel_scaffold1462:3806-12246(+) / protein_length=660 / sequence_SO=supercontig / SO=protein_coding / is_pseudo=false
MADVAGGEREREKRPAEHPPGGPAAAAAAPAVEGDDEEEDDDFGPMPQPAAGQTKKKRKVVIDEAMYLQNLPSGEMYEKSFMHREVVTKVVCSSESEFILTGSADGHVKFWKKTFDGIEFVKHFRAHLGKLYDLSLSEDGAFACSVGEDSAMKTFDVLNFDLVCMTKLSFRPFACCLLHKKGELSPLVAVSERQSPSLHLLEAMTGNGTPLRTLTRHVAPVHIIRALPKLGFALSIDRKGGIELWDPQSVSPPFAMPTKQSTGGTFRFGSKMDTDMFELQKSGTSASAVGVAPDSSLVAMLCEDFHLRVFRTHSFKLVKKFDETIEMYQTAQVDPKMALLHMDRLDFGKKLAVEKELRRSFDSVSLQTLMFDESSNFLIYPSIVGIKVVNLTNNKLCRVIGRGEKTERFLACALIQCKPKKKKTSGAIMSSSGASTRIEMADPTLICSGYNRHRFYLFSQREPEEASHAEGGGGAVRDVFNEKPSKEEAAAAIADMQNERALALGKQATIHTTMGDIIIKLFASEVPRTVENFTVHSRNGYFDETKFHRVIKGFMIQTGDPKGDGTGGESIWGGDFEDEFHRSLKHDRPYTVSMANSGPNTNGSQFFITTVPCPWLDNKHSVFGRVVKGMDVVHAIENVRTDGSEKPYKDVKVLTIKVTS